MPAFSGLSLLSVVAQLAVSVIAGVFYADKLGLVDVTGRLRDAVDARATPGGGRA